MREKKLHNDAGTVILQYKAARTLHLMKQNIIIFNFKVAS